jgi:hypothetical protein
MNKQTTSQNGKHREKKLIAITTTIAFQCTIGFSPLHGRKNNTQM